MPKRLICCCVGLALFAVGARGDERPPIALPKEIQGSQEKLGDWVNSFKNHTVDQLAKKLGAPTEKSTWNFEGNDELLLRYRSARPKCILEFYFFDDRVVTVSLQLLSD